MKTLFESAKVEEVKQRMAQLRPDSERQWGQMSPSPDTRPLLRSNRDGARQNNSAAHPSSDDSLDRWQRNR